MNLFFPMKQKQYFFGWKQRMFALKSPFFKTTFGAFSLHVQLSPIEASLD